MLTKADGDYFCSANKYPPEPDDDSYQETFSDIDTYKISLCYYLNNESATCEVLDEEYEPVRNSKEDTGPFSSQPHRTHSYYIQMQSTSASLCAPLTS